jgi:DNA-binding NarL/FixJ family response regulator
LLWKIVAAKLHLSESTVRNYLSSAIGKTGTRNRMEAMRETRQQGGVTLLPRCRPACIAHLTS